MEEEGEKRKRLIDLDWDKLLPSRDEAAPAPVLVVTAGGKQNAAAKGGGEKSQQCQSDDLKRLDDKQLYESIARIKRGIETLSSRMPDKGEKLRLNLKRHEDEREHRKWLRAEKERTSGFKKLSPDFQEIQWDPARVEEYFSSLQPEKYLCPRPSTCDDSSHQYQNHWEAFEQILTRPISDLPDRYILQRIIDALIQSNETPPEKRASLARLKSHIEDITDSYSLNAMRVEEMTHKIQHRISQVKNLTYIKAQFVPLNNQRKDMANEIQLRREKIKMLEAEIYSLKGEDFQLQEDIHNLGLKARQQEALLENERAEALAWDFVRTESAANMESVSQLWEAFKLQFNGS